MDEVTKQLIEAAVTAPPERKPGALRYLREGTLREVALRGSSSPLLCTVTNAAQLLAVSRSTIWRAIRAGRLKKVALYPGCERLRRADVEALAGGAP